MNSTKTLFRLVWLISISLLFAEGGKTRLWIIPRHPQAEQVLFDLTMSRGILALTSRNMNDTLIQGRLTTKVGNPLFDNHFIDDTQVIRAKTESTGEKDEENRFVEINEFRIPTDNHWEITTSALIPARYEIELAAAEAELSFREVLIRSFKMEAGVAKAVVAFYAPNRTRMEELSLQVGASKVVVQGLGNANAEKMDIEVGVGKCELDFSGMPSGSCEIHLSNGMGVARLYIPSNLGVRFITEGGFLSSFSIDNFVKKDNIYYSLNYEKAPIKYTFYIENALGAIEVIWEQ